MAVTKASSSMTSIGSPVFGCLRFWSEKTRRPCRRELATMVVVVALHVPPSDSCEAEPS